MCVCVCVCVKVLHARYLLQLLHESRRILRTFPTVMHASTLSAQRITVCGDLHGKLNDLLLIFWKVTYSALGISYTVKISVYRWIFCGEFLTYFNGTGAVYVCIRKSTE